MTSMSQHYESTPETKPSVMSAHIIDYSVLVEAVQLSVARLLDIQGAAEATSFNEVLAGKNPEDQERIICDIGNRFDDELIHFVTVAIVARRKERIVILADESEGINGGLPWQPKLEQHLQTLHEQGYLRNTRLDVERYSSREIDGLTEQVQDLALESAPTI